MLDELPKYADSHYLLEVYPERKHAALVLVLSSSAST